MASKAYTNYNPSNSWSDANLIQSAINQALLRINTILPCEIMALNGNNYDVKPLINRVDAQGNAVEYDTILNIPKQQKRGGNAGVIIEYIVGDKVAVGFCQRDITIIKKNWQRAKPNSLRKFYITDGIILDNLSNDKPEIYVKITKDGIEIQAKDKPIQLSTTGNVTMTVGGSLTANITGDANITATGALKLKGATVDIEGALNINGKAYLQHQHNNLIPGSFTAPSGGGLVTGESGGVMP